MIPDGQVTTVSGLRAGRLDGRTRMAQFKSPMGLAMDKDGALYVGDNGNHVIRILLPGEQPGGSQLERMSESSGSQVNRNLGRRGAHNSPPDDSAGRIAQWEWNNIYAIPQELGYMQADAGRNKSDTHYLVGVGTESSAVFAHTMRQLSRRSPAAIHNIWALSQLHALIIAAGVSKRSSVIQKDYPAGETHHLVSSKTERRKIREIVRKFNESPTHEPTTQVEPAVFSVD